MTEQESIVTANQLLEAYGRQGFEISMPTEEEYTLMRAAFAKLGRTTLPNGEFLVIKVLPADNP